MKTSAIKSIIITPGNAKVTRVSEVGVTDVPISEARRFDDLAKALGERLGIPAVVRDKGLPKPGNGTLVICRPDVLYRLEQEGFSEFRWIVAIDLDRVRILERTETLGLAASVEIRDYRRWVDSSLGHAVIIGRTEVAPLISAAVDAEPMQSSLRYSRLTRKESDFPTLLADYLKAYEGIAL